MVHFYPIEEAPKSFYEKRKSGKGEKDTLVKKWVYVWHETKMPVASLSYWLPEEKRWNGWTEHESPDMYAEVPVRP